MQIFARQNGSFLRFLKEMLTNKKTRRYISLRKKWLLVTLFWSIGPNMCACFFAPIQHASIGEIKVYAAKRRESRNWHNNLACIGDLSTLCKNFWKAAPADKLITQWHALDTRVRFSSRLLFHLLPFSMFRYISPTFEIIYPFPRNRLDLNYRHYIVLSTRQYNWWWFLSRAVYFSLISIFILSSSSFSNDVPHERYWHIAMPEKRKLFHWHISPIGIE